jgi:hypothetical protein
MKIIDGVVKKGIKCTKIGL